MTTLPDLALHYRQPARAWVEALPIGNGRLGAMVFGGAAQERLQLNEDTLWSGGPRDWNNPRAREVLPEVRRLLFAGKYAEADQLCGQMQGPFNQSYLPLGDLLLTFDGAEAPTAYRRWLDLDSAIAAVRYSIGDATFTREAFASAPHQAIVIRLSCDRPARISFTAVNLTNGAPPFFDTGTTAAVDTLPDPYDPANATAIGRTLVLSFDKRW